MESTALLVTSSCVQGSGYAGVPIAGHARWAEVGGGIIFVTYWEFTGLHKIYYFIFQGKEVIPLVKCRKC